MHSSHKRVLATVFAATLAACGGGGGDVAGGGAGAGAGGSSTGSIASGTTGSTSTGSAPGAGTQSGTGAQQSVSAKFQVNTTPTGVQILSQATRLADGGFAVAWTSQATADGAGDGVFMRRYSADGTPRAGEMRMNQQVGRRFDPAQIAGLKDGGTVAVWREDSPTENFRAIQLRRYDANGTLTYSRQDPYSSTENPGAWGIVALPDGGYVRTVASYDMGVLGYLTYIQRFSATNAELTALVQVGPRAAATDTAVHALNDGSLLLVWSQFDAGSNATSLFMQRFSANGQALGSPATIAGPANQQRPVVAVLSNNDIAMAWQRSDPDRHNYVITRRFSSDLTPMGPEQLVDREEDITPPVCVPPPGRPNACPTAFPVQTMPTVAEVAEADYVVSWYSEYRGSSSWARRYGTAGNVASGLIKVEGEMTGSALVGLPNGRALRVWSAPILDTDVFAREYYDAELR